MVIQLWYAKENASVFPFYNSIVCIIMKIEQKFYFVCPSTQQNKLLTVLLQ